MNYLAILVASLVAMVIGFLWYSPMLFGEIWMKLVGIDKKDMDKNSKNMGPIMVVALLMTILMSYVLAHFLTLMEVTDAAGAAELAFWVWLGFMLTQTIGSVLWEGRPFKLFLINVLYQLVTIQVLALILVSWL
jgi:hypothetical protein